MIGSSSTLKKAEKLPLIKNSSSLRLGKTERNSPSNSTLLESRDLQHIITDYGSTKYHRLSGLKSYSELSTKRDPNIPRKREYKCLSIRQNIRFAPPTLMKIESDYISTVQEQQVFIMD